MSDKKKIGIIGGGISGLVLGYYFSKNGYSPVIFERDLEPGGLLSTVKLGGVRLEKYYHHIFTSDKHTLDLIEELGLSKQISWLESSITLFYKEKIYPFSTSFDLLKFPHLNFLSKLRLGLGTIYLQQCKKWEKFKGKKASDWIKKYMGKEVWQVIWQPLFQGKFDEFYRDIAMSWFWARIHSRSAAKFRKKELLGYPINSYQEIIDLLISEIIKKGGRILLKKSVEKLLYKNEKGISLVADGEKYNFDLVISTITPPLFSEILPDNLENFKKQLSKVNYLSSISAILVLKEKLTDCYWTNVLDNDMPFTGIIEHTNFVSPSKYNNKHIVYVSHYTSDSSYLNANDKELLNKYLSFLKRINPAIESALEGFLIFRDRYTQPVITTDYPYKLLQFETPIKNLYQLSMAQIFPEDRGVDAAIRESKKLVDFIKRS